MFCCELCPFLCRVDRETRFGRCAAGREMVVNAAMVHRFEEPPISGTKGSGAIFFGGCPLHCEYCQNQEISKCADGRVVSATELVQIMRDLEAKGVHNLNFVTPTHFSDKIVEALKMYRPKVPVVWNTSGYEREETIQMLLPYVDIFLADFKYAEDELAMRYSHAPNYAEIATHAIDVMVKNKPLRYFEGGEILAQGVLARHLVLPSALQNTQKVTQIFKNRWEGRAILSLMRQFTPNGTEQHAELQRPLKPIEYRIALLRAQQQGLNDFFIQEKGAVGKQYVPEFNHSK